MARQTGGLVFRVKIDGAELVELKRHWHHLPEGCGWMQGKIQKHAGKRPLELSEDEFSWVVAVLDAVLQTPKRYPLDNPPGPLSWTPLEFVKKDDPRCIACQGLYERLNKAYERVIKGRRRRGTIEV